MQQEKARQDIEKKLDERAREEKEELKRERRGLFEERRNKQAKLKQLESKMELVKIVSSHTGFHIYNQLPGFFWQLYPSVGTNVNLWLPETKPNVLLYVLKFIMSSKLSEISVPELDVHLEINADSKGTRFGLSLYSKHICYWIA